MGMTGKYVAVESSLLGRIISGEEDIFGIDPAQCPRLDADKSWQAIQFLLCGSTEGGKPPEGYAVPVRSENKLNCAFDFDAFYITAKQAKEAADYLSLINYTSLKDMFDFELMKSNRIYPLSGRETPAEADIFFDYLYSYFEKLREYFKRMAEEGYAIIFYVM